MTELGRLRTDKANLSKEIKAGEKRMQVRNFAVIVCQFLANAITTGNANSREGAERKSYLITSKSRGSKSLASSKHLTK
jgi:hypothetical protein